VSVAIDRLGHGPQGSLMTRFRGVGLGIGGAVSVISAVASATPTLLIHGTGSSGAIVVAADAEGPVTWSTRAVCVGSEDCFATCVAEGGVTAHGRWVEADVDVELADSPCSAGRDPIPLSPGTTVSVTITASSTTGLPDAEELSTSVHFWSGAKINKTDLFKKKRQTLELTATRAPLPSVLEIVDPKNVQLRRPMYWDETALPFEVKSSRAVDRASLHLVSVRGKDRGRYVEWMAEEIVIEKLDGRGMYRFPGLEPAPGKYVATIEARQTGHAPAVREIEVLVAYGCGPAIATFAVGLLAAWGVRGLRQVEPVKRELVRRSLKSHIEKLEQRGADTGNTQKALKAFDENKTTGSKTMGARLKAANGKLTSNNLPPLSYDLDWTRWRSFAASAVIFLLGSLVALQQLWVGEPTWGTDEDLIAMFLLGAGLHGASFSTFEAIRKRLFPDDESTSGANVAGPSREETEPGEGRDRPAAYPPGP
jgi:hypothetical protein